MELTAADLWSRILQVVKTGLPEQSFDTWLARTSAAALSEGELIVEATTEFHVEWLEDKYASTIADAAARVLGRPIRITFTVGDNPALVEVPSVEVSRPTSPRQPPFSPAPSPPPSRTSSLNGRYTFDRFVVGGDNQLAAAACLAVCEKPARTYNPLFLYGGVGLGKTHLMHAIGNAILKTHSHTVVAYVTAEQFTNELITAIQEGTTAEFRRCYREMDLLLMDDIHFLEGKERTQEEFFHTFNALYDAQRQIVLTSDRPPKEIPGLEKRLVSRFEWGLVADIKAPDYETRVAILRKKAADDTLVIDPEVLDFIARSCTSSVRQLEGAVIKLLAYSSIKHQEISLPMAHAALQGVLNQRQATERPLVTAEGIRQAVAEHWGVKSHALTSKRRTKDLTVPRQVAMYLIRELLNLSLPRIGDLFGGRDHSTVIHSLRKVEKSMKDDPSFRQTIQELKDTVSRQG